MAYSIINKTKFGNCCQCGAEDTEVVKVAKSTYCVSCHKLNKANEQLEKQKQRNALRSDGTKVRKLSNKLEDTDIAERSALIADIDRYFSIYIRLREADKHGMTMCFTTRKRHHYKDLQCSHFIGRANLATRWLPDNCRPQTKHENEYKHGNLEVYAKYLEEENPGIVEQLRERAKEIYKPSTSELKQLLIEWRTKANMMINKLEKK